MGCLAQTTLSSMVLPLRRQYNLQTMVETGTATGDSTVWAADHFNKVFSIERQPMLFRAARDRCRTYQNITLLLGDSRQRLPDILNALTEPAMFWLDAHSDTDTPILDELDMINTSPLRHVVLIDDAHQMHDMLHWHKPETREGAVWPSIPKIADKALAGRYAMEINEHDVIVLTPT